MSDHLAVIEFGELLAPRRHELEGDEHDPYDMRGVTLLWQAKPLHVGLVDPAGRLVAAAGLVLARAEAGGHAHDVVGFGGVIVARAYRGRGLARRIITAALERAAGLGPELAMLFCREDRAGLYARLGFSEIARPVLVAQPGGAAVMPLVTMWRTVHVGGDLPTGPVRLLTLPF